MKYKGNLINDLSGSMDGLVAASNRFGNYFRQKGLTTNPNSPDQAAVRQAFGQLAAEWRTITQVTRDLWKVYADATPIIKDGSPIILTGLQMYQRCLTPRRYWSLIAAATPPIDAGLPLYTPVSGICNTGTLFALDITLNPEDAWATANSGAMYVSNSEGQSPSINFFKAPYRRGGVVQGADVGPIPDTLSIPMRASWTPGKKIFVKINVMDSQGRLGQPQFLEVDVVL